MKNSSRKKYFSKEEALAKLQQYCAYQERCHQEVRSKLLDLGIYGDDLEEIIVELIRENFLNEERFARTFARGKFRMKKWGRNRILQALKQRDISEYCQRKAMTEIDEAAYLQALRDLLIKKSTSIQANNDFTRNAKLAKYAVGRGFESNLVWDEIKKMAE